MTKIQINEDNIFLVGDFDFSDFLSGPQKVSKSIFFQLSKKYNVHAFTYYQDGSKYNYFYKLFKIEELVPGAYFTGIFPLIKNIFHFKPRIIHITGFGRFVIIICLLKNILNYKIFYTVNGIVIYENKFFRKESKFSMWKNKIVEKLIYKKADEIFYLSDNILETVNYYFKDKNATFHLCANGIEEIFHNNAKIVKNLSEPLRIGFSSNVRKKEKGFEFLLESLNKLSFPITLIVFSFDEINLPINSNIKIIRYELQNTKNYISKSTDIDIFITASYYDNFNLSMVEMMAMGKIPVVTRQTGASRYIKDNFNGFTYEYGNSTKLINILNHLNNNRNLLESLSINAMKIYDILNWEKVIKSYQNIYNKYLSSNE